MTQVELAAAVKVTPPTIHDWRDRGLLAAMRGGGHGSPLVFGPTALERARIIKELRGAGHTLADVERILGRMELEEWQG